MPAITPLPTVAGSAIVGLEDAQHRLVQAGGPARAPVTELHQSLYAHLGEERIVEHPGALEIIGAECDVTNHRDLAKTVGMTLDVRRQCATATELQIGCASRQKDSMHLGAYGSAEGMAKHALRDATGDLCCAAQSRPVWVVGCQDGSAAWRRTRAVSLDRLDKQASSAWSNEAIAMTITLAIDVYGTLIDPLGIAETLGTYVGEQALAFTNERFGANLSAAASTD